MASKTDSFIEDIVFIFDECARLQRLVAENFRDIPKEDLWSSLPHPDGHGHMFCGRAASLRLSGLAREAGRRFGLSRRVRLETLRKPLDRLVVRRFLVEKRPIDTKQVDRLLSAVAKAAKAECKTATHLIPCHLMNAKDPDDIRIGPVTFRNRAAFRRQLLVKLRGHGAALPEERKRLSRTLMAQALGYFRNFGWVAEVQIDNCDSGTSTQIAERAVFAALDCLQLVLRARNTAKMRVGGPAISWDRRASLTLDENGNLWAGTFSGSFGQINFPDGWSSALQDDELVHYLQLAGIALEAAVDPDVVRPLSRRFLDAAQWFGEALRDTSPSTRVVKFVTALERLLMTEERDDITSLISERLAAICFNPANPARRAELRQEVRDAYALRSKLVHGSISPRDEEVAHAVPQVADLCEDALLQALDVFGPDGLRSDDVGTNSLPGGLAEWSNGPMRQKPGRPPARTR